VDHTGAIRSFIIAEFLPDVPAETLATDYDLMAGGVIDSLGVLKLLAWLEDRFELAVDDVELDPDSFRSVDAINDFLGRVAAPAPAG
jgi:acyl carrier protein